MKILLIGNFAPPYEEESLHNLTLLNRLKEEGNDCTVINISENPSREDEFINVKGFFDFVFRIMRHGWRKDIIHISTKGYTRVTLLKLLSLIALSKLFRIKSIVTLCSEFFSIFGQLRSRLGGEQAIYLSFSMAHKIIIGDKDTCGIVYAHKLRDNFELIPLFINIPEDISGNEQAILEKLQNKKKVIVFFNVIYPSLLFDVLNKMLTDYLNPGMNQSGSYPGIGVVVSFSEKSSTELQHIIEGEGRLSENIVFIEPDNARLLSLAYAKADLILRPMTCDGKIFFKDFAVVVRRPEHYNNYLYFPTSLLLIKEGDLSDLCARILNNLLTEKRIEELPQSTMEDFYSKIRNVYNNYLN